MKLLTPSEVALRVGVTPDTVRHWERTGRLAAIKTPTGRRLFEVQVVEDFIKQHRRASAATKPASIVAR